NSATNDTETSPCDGDVGVLIGIEEEDITNQKNCIELNELIDNAQVKLQLEGLKLDAENETLQNEKGFSLRKNSLNQTYTSPTILANQGTIDFPPLSNIFGVAHTHPHQSNGANPMFSAMDAFALNEHNTAFNHDMSGTDESLSVYILVVATGTYAVKINDLDAINAYTIEFPTERSKLREHRKLNDKYNEYYNPITQQTGDFDDFEKEFTKYIQSKGISLYKAENDLSNWNRLEYNASSPNNIETTNCSQN
ncbi:hypothetical protein, partial [Psychroserpens burtonensis]|uniref:hypothetical protein n=1 Tax=Psychroserpens burtonensis TaxID=49278 RepID=UPI00164AAB70